MQKNGAQNRRHDDHKAKDQKFFAKTRSIDDQSSDSLKETGPVRKYRKLRIEWPTLCLIIACYGVWFLAGALIYPSYPVLALILLTLSVAMQSSLMHEASHGHPTRNSLLNELLVALPIGLVYPYRRFKQLHLRHHADEDLTDPFDDPESYYRAFWKYRDMPRWAQFILRLNNSMVGRFVLNPLLATAIFIVSEGKLLREGDRAVRKAWRNHLLGLVPVLAILSFIFELPLWLYILVPTWLGQSLISIRSFAEHQWSERPDGRTIIVERSPLALLFLNNNLHLVHHKRPALAWYRLPELYRSERDDWLALNNHYLFRGYFQLLLRYGFRSKEPVVHPFLRRDPEPGRAFQPRIKGHNVNGAGTIPVPASRIDD